MPRRLNLTLERRLKTGNYNTRRTFEFFDPFPLGFGTLPEKMVYYALTKFGIEFYYLNDISFNHPDASFFKTYQVDFYIPKAKMLIEVQGAYWHSKPKVIESDSYKLAVYESFGYAARAWWDYDIMAGVDALILKEPKLRALIKPKTNMTKSTELKPKRRTKTDSSKGIRTLNARRKRYKTGRISSRKLRHAKDSYTPTTRR